MLPADKSRRIGQLYKLRPPWVVPDWRRRLGWTGGGQKLHWGLNWGFAAMPALSQSLEPLQIVDTQHTRYLITR